MPDFVRGKPDFSQHSRRQLIDDARANLISLRGQMITGALKNWRTNFVVGISYAHYLIYSPLPSEPQEIMCSTLLMGSGASAELITSAYHAYARDPSLLFVNEDAIGTETLTHDADGFLISTNWT